MKRLDKALADRHAALEYDQGNLEYLIDRGWAYHLVEQFEAALTDFNRVLELDPDNVLVLRSRGATYRRIDQFEAALTDFNRVLELDPETGTDLWVDRGLLLSYLGRYSDALTAYQNTPNWEQNHISLYNVAVVMARWKGVTEAEHHIQRSRVALEALDCGEQQGEKHYGLGGLAAILGEINQALDYLKQALDIEPATVDWARHDIAWLDLRDDAKFRSMISLRSK